MNHSEQGELHDIAQVLLAQGGFEPKTFSLQGMQGGRNNRVWRLEGEAFTLLLKRYYSHPSDSRNRLANEVGFLNFLRDQGVTVTPRVFATAPESQFSLLEFLPGSPPRIESVSADHVAQATDFVLSTNEHRHEPAALILPSASEAAFSFNEHLQLMQRRIDRLTSLPIGDEIDRQAKNFALGEVVPLWEAVQRRIVCCGADLGERLPVSERCLSPSDFGFHNTLQDERGCLRFVDFEYAGWDDPAKLICDFANQPDMLLCSELSQLFREAVIPTFPNPAALELRVKLLEPLFQLKWSCICLNLFFAAGKDRHHFTDGNTDADGARRTLQLQKARMMAERASTTFSIR